MFIHYLSRSHIWNWWDSFLQAFYPSQYTLFLTIYTGKRLQSYQCIELTINDDVIAKVRALSEGEDAKKITDNFPMFEWTPGVLINEDGSEEDTPIIDETEVNNNEPERELNVQEENETNDNDDA